MTTIRLILPVVAATWLASTAVAAAATPTTPQAFGKARPAVTVQPDGLLICEAEEFRPAKTTGGWKAGRWGENYYAATFANSFLSRKAFLGAPEQCDNAAASIDVDIARAGRYLVLVRYEAAYRFETQFRVQVVQGGRTLVDRLYGARKNLKIWAFRQKLKAEVGWSWGAVENIVWEGHDVFAELKPGRATIRLLASKQPEPAARRHVDLVMLTTDVEQVAMRIEKENYLPLDGMLTQSGDVWLQVTNLGDKPLNFTGGRATGGGNWQQHSPYWVHLRQWKIPSIPVAAGKTSEWIDVGGTMDSLNDGQWSWTGNGRYLARFGVKDARGKIVPLAEFTGEGRLALAADADTRYSRRLRKPEAVLFELLARLKAANPAPHGRAPSRTTIYAQTFTPLDSGRHLAAVEEFKRMFGVSDPTAGAAGGRGHIDVRSVPTAKLEAYCRGLGERAKNIAVVSLGDEIGLPAPSGTAAAERFRTWLKQRRLKPADIDLAAGNDWNKISYSTAPATRQSKPGLYYWSMRYRYHYGIQAIKERTDILARHLPNAGIGANFSPHYPQEHMFLGEVYKWVTVFRDSGMTMPWSEDYIWQVPVGTPQMNHINLDLFRAGLRHHPDRRIHYYVMPHMPNNTPRQWRRLFFGALAHGMKIVNLFEFRPVHVAYTENHVDDPAMYRMVLKSFRELGTFEDMIQDGRVRGATAAMWFSQAGDIWGDSHGSFACAKRGLYTAIRHQQIPLDFVIEADTADGTLAKYRTLYLADAHVSKAASAAIAAWVKAGGRLFVTAGGGMFDEHNRPNTVLRELLGVEQSSLDEPEQARLTWIKQDLPFAPPVATVRWTGDERTGDLPVFGARSRIKSTGAMTVFRFTDGSPAVTRHSVGRGTVDYCAFLPALSYYRPAIPMRPVDRGATDDAMIHFLPTAFDPRIAALLRSTVDEPSLPVSCSEPLVESTIIESEHGTLIPLVNWSGKPIERLEVNIRIDLPSGKPRLASGGKLTVTRDKNHARAVLSIDAADALIFPK